MSEDEDLRERVQGMHEVMLKLIDAGKDSLARQRAFMTVLLALVQTHPDRSALDRALDRAVADAAAGIQNSQEQLDTYEQTLAVIRSPH